MERATRAERSGGGKYMCLMLQEWLRETHPMPGADVAVVPTHREPLKSHDVSTMPSCRPHLWTAPLLSSIEDQRRTFPMEKEERPVSPTPELMLF